MHNTHEDTQGKASAKNPTICIIIEGGNTSELYKALVLTTSQLLVQSSWMLTGSRLLIKFLLYPPSLLFPCAVSLGDPPVTKCNTNHSH